MMKQFATDKCSKEDNWESQVGYKNYSIQTQNVKTTETRKIRFLRKFSNQRGILKGTKASEVH